MKIEIRKSKKFWLRQKFYLRIVADNGEPIGPPEMYATYVGARDSALALRDAHYVVLDRT